MTLFSSSDPFMFQTRKSRGIQRTEPYLRSPGMQRNICIRNLIKDFFPEIEPESLI